MTRRLTFEDVAQVIDLMRYTEHDNYSEVGLPPLELQRAIKMLTTGGVRSTTSAPGELGRAPKFAKTDPKANELRQQLRASEDEIHKLKEHIKTLTGVSPNRMLPSRE